MLKSMTGYGRSTLSSKLGRFVAEIQSVNRKHLEISIALPKEFARFEMDLRKFIGTLLLRGQVTLKISALFETTSPVTVTPNRGLAQQIKTAWETLANELDLDLDETALLRILSGTENILTYSDELQEEESYRTALFDLVQQALQHLLEMRIREGSHLQKDISGRFHLLRTNMDFIASQANEATTRYRQKLIERIEEILPGAVENEERILKEVALYAERADITEEVTRFYSHLDQSMALVHSEKAAIGKTLEFLLQELNREINTIGSKSSNVAVSQKVVEIKSELERIREQIQNVE